MKIEIQDEEQYTLLRPMGGPLLEDNLDYLRGIISEKIDGGNFNFILDMEWTGEQEASIAASLEMLNRTISAKRGILVVATPYHELIEALEAHEIIAAPTLTEAVDYVYMEQIQREFEDEGMNGFAEDE